MSALTVPGVARAPPKPLPAIQPGPLSRGSGTPQPPSPTAGKALSHTSATSNAFDPESPSRPAEDPLVSSLDDISGGDPSSSRGGAASRLGYTDELEMRFIWDRVLGRGNHGTVVRAVIDRFDGTEFACKRLPKAAPGEFKSREERDAADAAQLAHIKREIGLFTKLRSSLNVAKLEQVYEDKTHVYLVMELCRGPALDALVADGPVAEKDVSRYMRNVVRTITQVHDKGEEHGGVDAAKFMLLSEDRESTLKATGFGRIGQRTGEFFADMAQMAPEVLQRGGQSIGKHADMWATGLLATRLLTTYFPFDDIIENAVDRAGVLPSAGPLQDLFENPLVPSGAALFVSAAVMLLDFSRPHWGPVTAKARDWVVRALALNPAERMTPAAALAHPWLKRPGPKAAPAASGSAGKASVDEPLEQSPSIVQRIQRFGDFGAVKRIALGRIAGDMLKQTEKYADNTPEPKFLGERTHSLTPVAADASAPLTPITEHKSAEAPAATAEVGGSPQKQQKKGDVPPGLGNGLLEHMMMSDGTINRFSLADGLAQLGYTVTDSEIDRLLEQLAAVPGVETSESVSKESFAASQLDWEALQGQDKREDWEGMARAAFDALDLDGDGTVHRSELQIMLVGRCPEEEIAAAVDAAFADAGVPANTNSLDFPAFLRLLGTQEASDERGSPAGAPMIEKYASLRPERRSLEQRASAAEPSGSANGNLFFTVCSSAGDVARARLSALSCDLDASGLFLGESSPLTRRLSRQFSLSAALPAVLERAGGAARRLSCASSAACRYAAVPDVGSFGGGGGSGGGGVRAVAGGCEGDGGDGESEGDVARRAAAWDAQRSVGKRQARVSGPPAKLMERFAGDTV